MFVHHRQWQAYWQNMPKSRNNSFPVGPAGEGLHIADSVHIRTAAVAAKKQHIVGCLVAQSTVVAVDAADTDWVAAGNTDWTSIADIVTVAGVLAGVLAAAAARTGCWEEEEVVVVAAGEPSCCIRIHS